MDTVLQKPVYAVLLASGQGERMGSPLPKQFLKIGEKTVLEHSLHTFAAMDEIAGMVLVVHPDYRDLMEDLLVHHPVDKVIGVVNGGDTRQQSSYIGLMNVPVKSGWVLIHDAVRPLVSATVARSCLDALSQARAATSAILSSDTIIEVDEQGFIAAVPLRHLLRRVQTPQAFDLALILQAHQMARDEGFYHATDDCSLILRYNLAPVRVVSGEERNLKLTHMEDLALAEYLLNGGGR